VEGSTSPCNFTYSAVYAASMPTAAYSYPDTEQFVTRQSVPGCGKPNGQETSVLYDFHKSLSTRILIPDGYCSTQHNIIIEPLVI
jgi:hypothetical protein